MVAFNATGADPSSGSVVAVDRSIGSSSGSVVAGDRSTCSSNPSLAVPVSPTPRKVRTLPLEQILVAFNSHADSAKTPRNHLSSLTMLC